MKKPLHTPGPWGLNIGDREKRECARVYRTDGVDDDSWLIAHVTIECMNKEQQAEDLGNARLIAQAPALFDIACDALKISDAEIRRGNLPLHELVREKNWNDSLRSVIRKVKGGAK